VDSFADLRQHLRFRPFERHIIKRLIKPFNDLLALHEGYPIDAHNLVGEGLMEGLQFNVDGFFDRGRAHLLGIVDEIMYPGSVAFNRFEYPSSAPLPAKERMYRTALAAMRAIGFRHGFFNVELAYHPANDTLRVVEINPRMASQFADLYRWVDGLDLYDIELALALGETPRCEATPQPNSHAASFVFRKFDGAPLARPPGRTQVESMGRRHPDVHLMLYLKSAREVRRDMKWLGSYRFGVLNAPGRDRTDLYARYREIRDILGFAGHCGPEPAPLWSGVPALHP
jgi:hypothetical protein